MTYSKLLIATDLSTEANVAIHAGAELCARDQAQLTLLHVVDLAALLPSAPVFLPRGKEESLRAEVHSRVSETLQEICDREVPASVPCECIVEESRSVSETICDYGVEYGYDAIVIATHGRSGFSHLLLGSVAERVIRHAQIPVLVVPVPPPD